jgi:hypothetical protein
MDAWRPKHVEDYDTIKCLWKWKCIKLGTLLWYIMIYGQQNIKFSKIMLPTVQTPDMLSGCKLYWAVNHTFHTLCFSTMLHVLHCLPVAMYVNLHCSYTDRPKHCGNIARWMDSSNNRVYNQFWCYEQYHCLLLFHHQPTPNLSSCMLLTVQNAERRTHVHQDNRNRRNYCDCPSVAIMSRPALLLLPSHVSQFKRTTQAYRTANNFNPFLSPGVNKSYMLNHLGDWILYSGSKYLWILGMELAPCHLEVTPRV